MSENTGTPEPQVETTSVFRADLLKEMENGANGNDATVAGTDNLAEGQALLAPCEVSEAVDAIKTIQSYTSQVG